MPRRRESALIVGCVLGLTACAATVPPRGPAHLSQPVEPDVGWFDCRQDTECEVIRDATCHLVSVNSTYAADVAAWIDQELSRAQTAECRERGLSYIAVCDSGKCSTARSSGRRQ